MSTSPAVCPPRRKQAGSSHHIGRGAESAAHRPANEREVLRVQLFGDGSVDSGDGPRLVDALPKSLPLLAYLLIERARPIPRDQLAFALWPDDDEESARANLRRHLFRLLRALPDEAGGVPWVLSSRKSVQWNPQAPCWIDVAEFERLSADAETAAAAIELYRDDLLARVEEPWLEAERARLRARQERNLTSAFDAAYRRRDFAQAVRHAHALLRLEPDNEAALRRVVSVRYESGDRAGALAEYERFAQTLFDEFGERPMPETLALADAIGAGDALEAAPAPDAEANVALPAGLPFVGRDAEIAALTDAWNAALAGRGSVVFVTGEAGIGKSRLVDVFAQQCARDGGSVFVGRTAPVEGQPYEVIAHALRSALPVILDRTTDPLWLGTIASIVPEVSARRPDIVRPPALDGRAERTRLFEAIARVIGDAARARPRFVVFEDVHWASNTTFEALDDLAHRLETMRVVVVLTARDDVSPEHPFNRLRSRITRAGHGTTIALDALALSDVANLLRDRAFAGNVDERAAALFAQTEGHPLFLALALDEDSSAGTLADAIGRKFDGLSDDARAFVDFAAVAGAGFDLDLVRNISGWPESRAIDALDELIDRRVIRGASAPHYADYAFAHALFWSYVYDRMPAQKRSHGHRRAARALAAAAASAPSLARELARHYESSDQAGAAASAYVRAAEYAAGIGANDEALAFASRAIGIAGDERTALPALALRETLYARVGKRPEQRTDLDAFARFAHTSDDPDLLCEAALRRAALAQAIGDREEERASIAALATALGRSNRSHWRGEVALVQARGEIATGDIGRAAAHADEALAAFRLEDDAEGALRALTLSAEIASSRSDYDAARETLAQATAIAQRFVEPVPLLRVLRSAAAASFVARDFPAVAEATQQALKLSERIGDLESEAELVSRLASLAARRFDVSDARTLYARARQRYATLNNPRALAGLLLNGSMLEFAIGNVAVALDRLNDAAVRFGELDDLRGRCLAFVNASLALSFLGRHDEAIASARTGIEIAQQCRYPMIEAQAFANLGAAHRRAGDPEAAIDTVYVALALRRPTTSTVDLAEDLSDLALACLAVDRFDEAAVAVSEYLPFISELTTQSLFAQDLCFSAALALRGVSDPRADEYGVIAQAVIETRLARLPDDEARRTFRAFGQNPAILAWAQEENG